MALKRLPFRNLIRVMSAVAGAPLVVLSSLMPRSKRRWIFGSQGGFHDNSRYLMESVVAHHPEIDAVWLALDEKTLNAVHAAGLKAVRAGSWSATLHLLRSGVGVISNGLGDLSRGLIGGMFITQLYHAVPLKKVHLDFPGDCQVTSSRSMLGRLINFAVLTASKFAWRRNNLIIATSEYAAKRMASAFGVPADRVVVTGTPRADVLLGQDEPLLAADERLREEFFPDLPCVRGSQESCRIVLYAPTWREDGKEDCLWESFDAEEVNRGLAAIGAVLAIRLHPFSQTDIYQELEAKQLSHIMPVRGPVDFQQLMRCSSLLITDYSSACVDFSVLGRPVIFFMPDFDAYKGSRDFYDPLEELTLGKQCDRWPEVLEEVGRCLAGEAQSMEVSEKIRRSFHQFEDTANCERIVAEIKKRVGLAG